MSLLDKINLSSTRNLRLHDQLVIREHTDVKLTLISDSYDFSRRMTTMSAHSNKIKGPIFRFFTKFKTITNKEEFVFLIQLFQRNKISVKPVGLFQLASGVYRGYLATVKCLG